MICKITNISQWKLLFLNMIRSAFGFICFFCFFTFAHGDDLNNSLQGKNIVSLKNEALQHFQQGKIKEAERKYNILFKKCKGSCNRNCLEIYLGKLSTDITLNKFANIAIYLEFIEQCCFYLKDREGLSEFLRLKGLYLRLIGKNKEAIKIYQSALNNCDNWELRSIIQNSLGNIYVDINSFNDAYLLYKSSISTLLREVKESSDYMEYIGNTYSNIGVVKDYLGQLDSSIYYYNLSLDIFLRHYGEEHYEVARVIYNIGHVEQNKGNYRSALQKYNRALNIYMKVHGKNHNEVSRIYGAIGQIYLKLNDHDKALLFFRREQEILTKLFGKEHSAIGYSLNDIGTVFESRGNYDRAKGYYKKAYNIRSRSFGNKHLEVGQSLYSLAKLNLKLGNIDSAYLYSLENLSILATLLGKNLEGSLMDNYLLHSKILIEQGLEQEALNNILTAYKNIKGDNRLNKLKHSQLLVLLSSLKSEENEEEAISLANKSIQILKGKKSGEVFENTNNAVVNGQLINAYFNRGLIFKQKGLLKYNLNFLEQAVSDFEDVIKRISFQRKLLISEDSKLFFSEQVSTTCKKALDVLFFLMENCDDSQKRENYLNQVFNFFEASKYNVLYEFAGNLNDQFIQGIPLEIQKEEKELNREIIFLQKEILAKENNEDVTFLNQIAFNTNNRYDSLNKKIKKEYPEYYYLKYKRKTVLIDSLKKAISYNDCVIEYAYGDTSVYGLLINKDSVIFERLSNISYLEREIDNCKNNSKGENKELLSKSLFKIYKILLGSFKKELRPTNIIIPNAEISTIPFEILIDSVVSISNLKQHYLINKHTFLYAPSKSLYLFNNNSKKAKSKMLTIAPDFSRSKNFSNLTWSQEEAKAITKLFNGVLFNKNSISKEKLIKAVSTSNILHFATHGVEDFETPINSHLILGSDSVSNIEERLFIYDLYILNLNLDLIALSSCSSGKGEIMKGEGQMSLARGFALAGVRNILMSLWDVPDKQTSQIMINFYKNLRKGIKKAEALRQAKLDYLNQTDVYGALPFYWGAFILQSNIDEINISKGNFNKLFSRGLFGLFLIFCISSFCFLSRKME